MDGFEGKVQFVWQVADLLRGDYKLAEYREVILPLLALCRRDAVPEVGSWARCCSTTPGPAPAS